MCMADHEAAARRKRAWPDETFDVEGVPVAVRARCMTCRCYVIPARLVHEPNGMCHVEAPGKYPCPVCGQMDQYVNVWISARARHHAESRRLLKEQGFVTKLYGPLRAPLEDELPAAGDPNTTSTWAMVPRRGGGGMLAHDAVRCRTCRARVAP